MLVRCVDPANSNLELGKVYTALNENLEPLSELEWSRLKDCELLNILLPNASIDSFAVWRFRPESWFQDFEQDFDSISTKDESENYGETIIDEEKCIEPINIQPEMVNHPQHYNHGKYEVIDVIEDWNLGFNLGNTIKYIGRAGHKDDVLQDLNKALWYLQREIARLEKQRDEELRF